MRYFYLRMILVLFAFLISSGCIKKCGTFKYIGEASPERRVRETGDYKITEERRRKKYKKICSYVVKGKNPLEQLIHLPFAIIDGIFKVIRKEKVSDTVEVKFESFGNWQEVRRESRREKEKRR